MVTWLKFLNSYSDYGACPNEPRALALLPGLGFCARRANQTPRRPSRRNRCRTTSLGAWKKWCWEGGRGLLGAGGLIFSAPMCHGYFFEVIFLTPGVGPANHLIFLAPIFFGPLGTFFYTRNDFFDPQLPY